jgi:hypothetical protein
MKKMILVFLILGLGWTWASLGLAGDIGYRFREQSTPLKRLPGPPSSTVVATDALIGRPLGLATTIAGAAVFLVTLPASIPSQSVGDAAWGLVGRPGGWTFVRPLGREVPQFEEGTVFRP